MASIPAVAESSAAIVVRSPSSGWRAASALAAHEADTTAVHGIANTAVLETTTGSAAKVTAHAGASDPHGDRAYTDSAITSAVTARQPLDGDLTTIAALDSATAGMLATDGAGWLRKTYAQVRTALGLATVATSGAYTDLTGKPTLATVATSGSASDLASGTLADARIASTIARDTEVAAAVAKIGRGVRIYSAGNGQNTVNGVEGAAHLNTLAYNDDAVLYTHDAVTNYSVTVHEAGAYLARGSIRFANAAIGERVVLIAVNGTTVSEVGLTITGTITLPIAVDLTLAAGDALQLRYYTSGGDAVLLDDFSPRSVHLAVRYLGAPA